MTAEQPVAEPQMAPAAAPPIPALQKWASWGTGVGIEIGQENLFFTLTRVRPGGIHVLDSMVIERYRERPAGEWGGAYQDFLKKNKVSHVSATVVLPPGDCIARVAAFPGVLDKDLGAAVQYQLDGLHPYPEEEAVHAYARLKGERKSNIAVGIARQPVIQDYATLFDEAGIPVSAFLTPAAAIYSALRVLQPVPASQFLGIVEYEGSTLLYGESETHPVYCVQFPAGSDRAVSAAQAQLRLGDEPLVARLASLLPRAQREDLTWPLAYAASLAGALPGASLQVNLLPVDRRTVSSPWRWVPTIVLLVLLAILGLGFSYYQEYENRRLLTKLDAEIAKVQPRVLQVNSIQKQIEEKSKRLAYLVDIAGYPQQDLDVIRELTRILPGTAFVARLDITRSDVAMSGEVDQSMELLRLLDNSPLFRDSEFVSTPSRSPNGKEIFQIRTRREFPALPKPGAQPAQPQVPQPGVQLLPPGVNSTPLPRVAPPPPLPPGVR